MSAPSRTTTRAAKAPLTKAHVAKGITSPYPTHERDRAAVAPKSQGRLGDATTVARLGSASSRPPSHRALRPVSGRKDGEAAAVILGDPTESPEEPRRSVEEEDATVVGATALDFLAVSSSVERENSADTVFSQKAGEGEGEAAVVPPLSVSLHSRVEEAEEQLRHLTARVNARKVS